MPECGELLVKQCDELKRRITDALALSERHRSENVKLRCQRDRLRDAAKAMMNAWWLRPDQLHIFSAQPPPSNMQAELTVIYKELDAAIKETEEV